MCVNQRFVSNRFAHTVAPARQRFDDDANAGTGGARHHYESAAAETDTVSDTAPGDDTGAKSAADDCTALLGADGSVDADADAQTASDVL